MNASRDFESIACDILDEAYQKDPAKAELTLIRQIHEYDNCTTIQTAINSDDLNLIASPCLQNVLVKIWYNKIIPDIHRQNVDKYIFTFTLLLFSSFFNFFVSVFVFSSFCR